MRDEFNDGSYSDNIIEKVVGIISVGDDPQNIRALLRKWERANPLDSIESIVFPREGSQHSLATECAKRGKVKILAALHSVGFDLSFPDREGRNRSRRC
ncbi:MAG: hypothetical protein GC137_02520 [Alphaproteobacteria bacterium]|nr:hypothetical protein [Alphaproteobacteria bacterium]